MLQIIDRGPLGDVDVIILARSSAMWGPFFWEDARRGPLVFMSLSRENAQ
jgi:hypothetical protein